jgi:hypothetical protein
MAFFTTECTEALLVELGLTDALHEYERNDLLGSSVVVDRSILALLHVSATHYSTYPDAHYLLCLRGHAFNVWSRPNNDGIRRVEIFRRSKVRGIRNKELVNVVHEAITFIWPDANSWTVAMHHEKFTVRRFIFAALLGPFIWLVIKLILVIFLAGEKIGLISSKSKP